MDEAEEFEKNYNVWTLKEDIKSTDINPELSKCLEEFLTKTSTFDMDKIYKEHRQNNKNEFIKCSDIKKEIENEVMTKDQLLSQIRSLSFECNYVFKNDKNEHQIFKIKSQIYTVINCIAKDMRGLEPNDKQEVVENLGKFIEHIDNLLDDKIKQLKENNIKLLNKENT